MTHAEFVHLHNHTEYSLLDGACRISDDRGLPGEFIKLMASYKMPSLAITDHGNMYGAIEFYTKCQDAGIKPIIGCEFYLAPKSRFDKNPESENTHLVLLAKNYNGYKNLMKITSIAHTEGFYYKPRIDKQILENYNKDLICLSGCIHGEISKSLLNGNFENAKKIALYYKSLFNDDFYLEIMDNNLPEQKKIISEFINLSKQTQIQLVATNDCHYLHKQDAYAHEILLCIGTGTTIDNPKRLRFSSNEFYYKSPQEMIKLFDYIPEAIKNTLIISEKCSLELNFEQLLLPYFKVPENFTPDTYLKKLCVEGIKKKYPTETKEITDRLNYELEIIKKMKFSSYFLIVYDFVQYAKKNHIPVGPGRGSGAGSIVAYLLDITDICPLKYGLLFERFLNPQRKTMPDFDIDFADNGRDTVINYVREKYGEKNVAQIITFDSLQARSVIRDVARVMGFSVQEGDRIAKFIPSGSSIYYSLQTVPELKTEYTNNQAIKQLIDIAQKLEGLKRHTSIHAAGLVIGNDEIINFSPLTKTKTSKKNSEQEIIITQYDDDSLIKLGLLKIDFLGLKTLTVLDETKKLIEKNKKTLDLQFSINDKKTFKLLQKAQTTGVFQLESSGMKDLLRKFNPTVFEDIIALVALFRPGPIGSGMLDEFIKRKHQKTKVKYDHPALESILKETYGVIVYQEQVMQISQKLAGFTATQADILRRAMGKKIPEEIEQQKENFINGTKKNGIDNKIAEKTFENILHFGGYGFNKSHAAAYAFLAYQTAYFKANYPLEYMCCLINSEIGKSTKKEEVNKLNTYINECAILGIKNLAPDIQKSDILFSIENNCLRAGLLMIKNVGEQAAKNIVSERRINGPFKSFMDFVRRVDARQVNRKTIESLIKAGVFDSLGHKENISLPSYIRAKYFKELEQLYKTKNNLLNLNQGVLFDFCKQENLEFSPWPEHVLLEYEREVLGYYFSGHPLAQYKKIIETISSHKISSLPSNNSPICIAGIIVNMVRKTSKKGEQWAKFKLENFDGEIDVIIFPSQYKNGISKLLNLYSLVVVKGKVKTQDENTSIIAEEIIPLDEYEKKYLQKAKQIYLKFSSVGVDDIFIKKLKDILKSFPGNTRTYFKIINPTVSKEIIYQTDIYVNLTEKYFHEINKLLGENSFEIVE